MLKLDRAFHELEKARQNGSQSCNDKVTDKDDAELIVSSIKNQLVVVIESLLHTKSNFEMAYDKLSTMFQVLSKFNLWLEETEKALNRTWPGDMKVNKFKVRLTKLLNHRFINMF